MSKIDRIDSKSIKVGLKSKIKIDFLQVYFYMIFLNEEQIAKLQFVLNVYCVKHFEKVVREFVKYITRML